MPDPRPCLAARLLAAAAPPVAPAADRAGPGEIGAARKMYVEGRGSGAPPVVAGAKAAADAGRAAKEAQARLAAAAPGARPVANADCGHEIRKAHPRLVIGPVGDVVEAARAGRAEGAR